MSSCCAFFCWNDNSEEEKEIQLANTLINLSFVAKLPYIAQQVCTRASSKYSLSLSLSFSVYFDCILLKEKPINFLKPENYLDISTLLCCTLFHHRAVSLICNTTEAITFLEPGNSFHAQTSLCLPQNAPIIIRFKRQKAFWANRWHRLTSNNRLSGESSWVTITQLKFGLKVETKNESLLRERWLIGKNCRI